MGTVGFMIDPMSPTPFYRQVADQIAAMIESGTLRPGDPVPSEKTLGQEHGVSRETVRDAMRLLRERGLVVTFQGRGTFVAER